MYTLKSPSNNSEMKEITEQFKNHSLAFKVEIDPKEDTISLHDNDWSIQGFSAIVKHIEELSGELNKWYYCDC